MLAVSPLVRALQVAGVCALAGCATAGRTSAPKSAPAFAATERYTWVDAYCSDGAVDLAAIGFERTVDVERRKDAVLLTYDTALATQGCRSTSVWSARRADKLYVYTLEPEAWIELPAGTVCGAEERAPSTGELHFAGDTLEIVTQRSPWCRGFDAHFVYRSTPTAELSGREVVARYIAHFGRGDAAALADLFDDNGALIESFSASRDGQPTRHEGRAAIRAYFERMFTSSRWHAARLLALTPADSGNTRDNALIADLEYMDSELREPLRVRSSFVLAAGEIFESDIQLVTDPQPVAPAGAEPKS